MKIINMFRFRIPPPQPPFQEDIIIIIETEINQTKSRGEKKRGCGVIPNINMFMVFMNELLLD